MTKKHFIALANVLRDIRTHEGWSLTEQENQGWNMAIDLVADRLADFCTSQSPRFDRQRWLAYIASKAYGK